VIKNENDSFWFAPELVRLSKSRKKIISYNCSYSSL